MVSQKHPKHMYMLIPCLLFILLHLKPIHVFIPFFTFCIFQEDVNRAVASARSAFSNSAPWRTMDASKRGALMHKVRLGNNYNSFHVLWLALFVCLCLFVYFINNVYEKSVTPYITVPMRVFWICVSLQLCDLLERHRDYLVALDTLDNGKPLCETRGDVDYTIGTIRYYAGWCDKIQGNTIPCGWYWNLLL